MTVVAIVGRAVSVERGLKQRNYTKNEAKKIKSDNFTRNNNGKIVNYYTVKKILHMSLFFNFGSVYLVRAKLPSISIQRYNFKNFKINLCVMFFF